MRAIRAALALLVLVVVGASMAPPAAAQSTAACGPDQSPDYAPDECSLAANTTEAEPGGTITLTGTGFMPNSEVTLEVLGVNLERISLGTVMTDANGNFSVEVTLPDGLPPGQYTITATGIDPFGNERVLSIVVTVGSEAPSSGGGAPAVGGTRTARTGWDPLPWTVGGSALVVFGAGAVIVARGRPATTGARHS